MGFKPVLAFPEAILFLNITNGMLQSAVLTYCIVKTC